MLYIQGGESLADLEDRSLLWGLALRFQGDGIESEGIGEMGSLGSSGGEGVGGFNE